MYDARHDDASRLATMGCRICLDAYTPDERPAALPCGHVFHHACLQDWLTTRTHGAVPSGCPLCKAPAALTDLVPLWASDTDLKQYVAAHPPDGRLSSMHAWVRHLHDYAIATHQLCPPAMSRAAAALPSALPDEARHALQDAMHALDDAVVHTDRLSRDLAQRMHALDERTRHVLAREERCRRDEQRLARDREHAEREHAALRHRQKHLAHVKDRLETQQHALDARARQLDEAHEAQTTRLHDSIAAAKSQCAESIRRAALAEEAATARCTDAERQVREAHEHVSDMTRALHETRTKNQRMADQLRELRAALEASKAKRRAERAASQHLYEQLRHQEQEPPIESASSSPPPVPTPTSTAQLLYDLDDTHFPMPGGTWSRPTKRPAREDAWPAALPRGARTVLGPRRRPTK